MRDRNVKVTSHPPERRRHKSVILFGCGAGGGCCCCCCCLHTLGGLAGAAIAPVFGSNRGPIQPRFLLLVEEYEADVPTAITATASPGEATAGPLRQSQRVSGVALYWWIMLALVIAAILLSMGIGGGEAVGVAIISLVLCLPGLQLLAAFLGALVIVASVRDDKKFQLLQIGKITLGCVVGTGLGILAMVAMAGGWGLF